MKSRNLFIIVLVLIVGLYIGDNVFLQKRDIASVSGVVTGVDTKYFDLTDIPESEFNLGFKSALMSGLVVEKTATTMGLSWGQFMVKNESGGKVYACDKYPFIEIELKAEGVAHSGELPMLVVRGPCLTSDDGKKILSLPVPLKDLNQKLIAEAELKIPLGSRGENFSVSAKNLYEPAPRYWNVTNVKLYNAKESLALDGYEIISLLDQALTLDFALAQ